MIDSILNIFSKLFDITKFKSENKRLFFKEVIEPLFLEMTQIHKDYLLTFEEMEKLTLDTNHNVETLREILIEKKNLFHLLREKIYQMNYAITEKKKDMRMIPSSIIDFSEACINYFRAGIDDFKIIETRDRVSYYEYYEKRNERFSDTFTPLSDPQKYRGAYSVAIEFLSDEYLYFDNKNYLQTRITHLISNIKLKWSDVTSFYAIAKIDSYK